MLSADMLREVLRELERRHSFLVTSHARPDGDAVGSSLALAAMLRQMGKTADVALHDPVPVIYRPLPFAEDVITATEIDGSYDAAVLLECDSPQRTRLEGLEHYFLISIDHHQSAKPFANVNWIDASACATAELVYRLARTAGIEITPEIAACLYTGVLTDTGSFSYPGTHAGTFALARELVEFGADPVLTAKNVYFTNPTAKMRLLGVALTNLRRERDLAWMYCTQNDMAHCGALEEDAEGLVNYALGISGVEVAVFFRELPGGRFRVSLRSKGAINVSRAAERFGGGGHGCASGFSVEGPLALAAERVLACLRVHSGPGVESFR